MVQLYILSLAGTDGVIMGERSLRPLPTSAWATVVYTLFMLGLCQWVGPRGLESTFWKWIDTDQTLVLL